MIQKLIKEFSELNDSLKILINSDASIEDIKRIDREIENLIESIFATSAQTDEDISSQMKFFVKLSLSSNDTGDDSSCYIAKLHMLIDRYHGLTTKKPKLAFVN